MNTSKDIATCCSALAHPSRVDIFKALLRHLPGGLNIGQLTGTLGMAPSTLAFHLKEMEQGGVVDRKSKGRETMITAKTEGLMGMALGLMALCCAGPEVTD